MRSQQRSLRKKSGGRYHPARTKRRFELAGFPAQTKLGEKKVRIVRTKGGHSKRQLLAAKIINVADKGKVQRTEIQNVIENPANPNLVRRNIMTKGAVVQTKIGKVRITSRPGQDGVVNGVLVS